MAGNVINSTLLTSLLVCVIVGIAEPARAHLVTTGMGPVYDGIGHFFLTLEDLLFVLVTAIYSGLCGRKWGRITMFTLPIAWFAGGVIGSFLDSLPGLPYATLSFLLFGILTAADFKLPVSIYLCLVGIFGMTHGLYNGLAMQAGPGLAGLLGIVGAVFVVSPLLSAVVIRINPVWCRVVFRVSGSWVAASGLLLLGWYFKQNQ